MIGAGAIALPITLRRQRELKRRYWLPRSMEPAAWALLDAIDRAAARKKKARLAALRQRRRA